MLSLYFSFLNITVQEQTVGALGKLNALHHNMQFITDHMELHMNDFVLVFVFQLRSLNSVWIHSVSCLSLKCSTSASIMDPEILNTVYCPVFAKV